MEEDLSFGAMCVCVLATAMWLKDGVPANQELFLQVLSTHSRPWIWELEMAYKLNDLPQTHSRNFYTLLEARPLNPTFLLPTDFVDPCFILRVPGIKNTGCFAEDQGSAPRTHMVVHTHL